MRKLPTPGTPKTPKGGAKADSIGPTVHAKTSDSSPQLLPPHDSAPAGQIIKRGRHEISPESRGAPISELDPFIEGIHPSLVVLIDHSTQLRVGWVLFDNTHRKVLQSSPAAIANQTGFSQQYDADAESTLSASTPRASSVERISTQSWPHKMQLDTNSITDIMYMQIAACAKKRSCLSQEVERLIVFAFRNNYLGCTSNKRGVWREVRAECSLRKIKSPSYSAVAERLDVLFSQEFLRFH